MFLISIGWSLIFVTLILVTARAKARTSIVVMLGAFFFLPSLCVLFTLPAALVVLCVAAVAIAASALSASPRTFRASVIAASLVGMGLTMNFAYRNVRRVQALAQRYPFESMSPRLSYEAAHFAHRADNDAAQITPVLNERWQSLEGELQRHRSLRWRSLREIHAGAVHHFIRAQSFGVGRMVDLTREHYLELPEAEPINQPAGMPDDGTPDFLAGVAGDEAENFLVRPAPAPKKPEALWSVHADSLLNFLSPDNEGYVQDREHVAGFLPHQFAASQGWISRPIVPRKVRLELVSLLKFEEPRVYLSKHLPRMDELHSAPTRPLDAFETRALESLRQGEDIVSDEQGPKTRALGALRALKQCLRCHTAREGDLLGAFSYTWWQRPAPRSDDAPPSATRWQFRPQHDRALALTGAPQ